MSVHTNLVKFWHHHSSGIHQFVLQKEYRGEYIHIIISMTKLCAVKPAGKHWIFGILPLTAVLQHHPAAFTSVCLVKQQHHILICPILPLQISRERSKISLPFPTDQLLCWRVIGLTITGTKKSVTPLSVGIHEIYPSWYLCRCRNSLWTLKLQVCVHCSRYLQYVLHGDETVGRDVSAGDEGKADSRVARWKWRDSDPSKSKKEQEREMEKCGLQRVYCHTGD